MTNTKLLECPDCDSISIRTETIDHVFGYGVPPNLVELNCILPMRICEHCDCRFVDYVGEDAMEEAVKLHLGNVI